MGDKGGRVVRMRAEKGGRMTFMTQKSMERRVKEPRPCQGTLLLELKCQGSNPASATYKLCDSGLCT